MKKTLWLALLAFVPMLLIAADFEQAMRAYERQNYRQAFALFSELAGQDDADAQYMLGRLYAAGNGTLQDYPEAHKWFNLAVARGHRHAAQARDAVAGNMSRRQIAQAQRMARDWRPGAGAEQAESVETEDDRDGPDLVAAIQQALNSFGYNAGPVDGQMGNRTRQAIRNYQSDNGLAVDGRPTRQLLAHLQGDQAASGAAPVAEQPDTDPQPRRRVLLHDTFQDGDYTRDPGWQVVAGQFWVESGIGLRTRQSQSAQNSQGSSTEEQLLNLIIGSVLEQATGQRPGDRPQYAEIYAPYRVSNAFAIEIQLTSLGAGGRLEFGPYQGARDSGYRLVYSADRRNSGLALLRLARSGSSVIESSRVPVFLEDGRAHTIQWTRDSNGEMVVYVDNQVLLRAADGAFRDPFSGFTLVNHGGDYAIQGVTIEGQ
jgi:peptidoglycan hydrolase-like protein with peptidoglycan-binding domain